MTERPDDDLLPQRSDDDTDTGWGGEPPGDSEDDTRRYEDDTRRYEEDTRRYDEDRPPHWEP